MATEVSWIVELNLQAGRKTEFTALMNEMINATRANEPGTLNYEWSTSADGAVCHIFERYVDSAAVMTHLGAFGEKFADRFLEAARPRAQDQGKRNLAVAGGLTHTGRVQAAEVGRIISGVCKPD
jgi:quinol monooxygenase YgiN